MEKLLRRNLMKALVLVMGVASIGGNVHGMLRYAPSEDSAHREESVSSDAPRQTVAAQVDELVRKFEVALRKKITGKTLPAAAAKLASDIHDVISASSGDGDSADQDAIGKVIVRLDKELVKHYGLLKGVSQEQFKNDLAPAVELLRNLVDRVNLAEHIPLKIADLSDEHQYNKYQLRLMDRQNSQNPTDHGFDDSDIVLDEHLASLQLQPNRRGAGQLNADYHQALGHDDNASVASSVHTPVRRPAHALPAVHHVAPAQEAAVAGEADTPAKAFNALMAIDVKNLTEANITKKGFLFNTFVVPFLANPIVNKVGAVQWKQMLDTGAKVHAVIADVNKDKATAKVGAIKAILAEYADDNDVLLVRAILSNLVGLASL